MKRLQSRKQQCLKLLWETPQSGCVTWVFRWITYAFMYSCLTVSHSSALSMGFYCDSSALCSAWVAALGLRLGGPIRVLLLVELLLSTLACRERSDHGDAGSSGFKMKVCLCWSWRHLDTSGHQHNQTGEGGAKPCSASHSQNPGEGGLAG